MSRGTKNQEIGALTGLRAVGAFLVVFYHFYQYRDGPLQPLIQAGGYLGVSLFFVLSGYILCHVYGKLAEDGTLQDWRNFLVRRVARLYPLHLFMIIVLVLAGMAGQATVWDVLGNLTMTHAWWSDQLSLIGASWSISVEFFFYLVFPFLLALRHGHWALIVFTVIAVLHVVAGLGWLADTPVGELFSRRLLFYGSYFVLGVCIFLMAQRYVLVRRLSEGNLAFVLLALSIIGACYEPRAIEPVFVVALPLLVRATHMSALAALTLGNRPMVFLGEISYAIYLSHQLVRQWLEVHFPGTPALPVIIIFSALCFFLVEKPCRTWARQALDRRNAQAATPAA